MNTNARLLIADDSEKLLAALQQHLLRYGFDVTTCTDAYMALARARIWRPDVLILDIRMPAGDGFSVLERIERIPELRGTPVIFITGDMSAELQLRAENLGACAFIHKPISFHALLQSIDASIASRSDHPKQEKTDKLWMIADPSVSGPYEIGEVES